MWTVNWTFAFDVMNAWCLAFARNQVLNNQLEWMLQVISQNISVWSSLMCGTLTYLAQGHHQHKDLTRSNRLTKPITNSVSRQTIPQRMSWSWSHCDYYKVSSLSPGMVQNIHGLFPILTQKCNLIKYELYLAFFQCADEVFNEEVFVCIYFTCTWKNWEGQKTDSLEVT